MEQSADVKTIVDIIKEIVKGYYGIIYRDTNSYKIVKFNKENFVSIFTQRNEQWQIEHDGDLTRFLLCSSSDSFSTDSDLLKTFNSYEVDGAILIASVAVVCDWSIFELAFEEKSANEVLEMIRSEKKLG